MVERRAAVMVTSNDNWCPSLLLVQEAERPKMNLTDSTWAGFWGI